MVWENRLAWQFCYSLLDFFLWNTILLYTRGCLYNLSDKGSGKQRWQVSFNCFVTILTLFPVPGDTEDRGWWCVKGWINGEITVLEGWALQEPVDKTWYTAHIPSFFPAQTTLKNICLFILEKNYYDPITKCYGSSWSSVGNKLVCIGLFQCFTWVHSRSQTVCAQNAG